MFNIRYWDETEGIKELKNVVSINNRNCDSDKFCTVNHSKNGDGWFRSIEIEKDSILEVYI